MKYRLRKFPLIHLPLPFVRKNVFYSKNIQYAYNFYGTDLNVCRDVYRTQSNIYGGASLRKSLKSLLSMLDWVLNTSLVQVLQHKTIIEVTIYLTQSKSNSKNCHCVLVSPINKTHLGLIKRVKFVLRFFVATDKLNTFRLE